MNWLIKHGIKKMVIFDHQMYSYLLNNQIKSQCGLPMRLLLKKIQKKGRKYYEI